MKSDGGGGEVVRAVDTAEAAAEAYEAHLVTRIFAPWARRAVDIAAPQPGEAVLDAACGTGIGVRLAAARVRPAGRMVGVDNDPGMVAVARRIAAEQGITAEWHCDSVLALPFADRSFDLVLCLQGPQFLSEPAAGLSELRRVLKPSGRLVASMWCAIEHNKGHHALAEALKRHNLTPATRPFSLGDEATVEALMRDAGFHGVTVHTRDGQASFPSIPAFVVGVAAGAPATRHVLAQLPEARRRDFVADVEAILSPYVTADGVRLPSRAHIVVATP